jgi:hypothetical protein
MSSEEGQASEPRASRSYPLELAARLRDYDNCHDGDVDEAAKLLERMHQLLASVYSQCGNHCSARQRHALTPAVRDSIRDLLYG